MLNIIDLSTPSINLIESGQDMVSDTSQQHDHATLLLRSYINLEEYATVQAVGGEQQRGCCCMFGHVVGLLHHRFTIVLSRCHPGLIHVLEQRSRPSSDISAAPTPLTLHSITSISIGSTLLCDRLTARALTIFADDPHPGMRERGHKEGASVYGMCQMTRTSGGQKVLR